jgi:hypothetical protein
MTSAPKAGLSLCLITFIVLLPWQHKAIQMSRIRRGFRQIKAYPKMGPENG